MKIINWTLTIGIMIIFSSCGNSNNGEQLRQAKERLEQENAKLRESEEQARILQENQAKLEEQLKQQEEARNLDKLAENEPISISTIVIKNITKQGTVLSTETERVFKRDQVRFIAWYTDYTDNVVKAGGKTYGILYVKYMKKNDDDVSWTTFNYQDSFYQIDGNSSGYSQKINMVDDGKEYGSWSSSLGSETGYNFEVGKWKIELYWDQNDKGKAIYLGGNYFEIY